VAPRLPWEGEFAKGDFVWKNAHHTGIFEGFRGRREGRKRRSIFRKSPFLTFPGGRFAKNEKFPGEGNQE